MNIFLRINSITWWSDGRNWFSLIEYNICDTLVNSLAPGRCSCCLNLLIFKPYKRYLEDFMWNYLQVNATRPHRWLVSIASDNCLAVRQMSANKPSLSPCWPRFTQIAMFMGPTWGPPGSCRPQMGPMLAPWTLLSGYVSIWLHCATMTHIYT